MGSPVTYYTLTQCGDIILPEIDVTNDLSAYVGMVIKVSTLTGPGNTFPCYTVGVVTGALPPGIITLPDSVVIHSFDDCTTCLVTHCYTLTDCLLVNPHPPVTVSADLSFYVGKIVNISTFTTKCMTVSVYVSPPGPIRGLCPLDPVVISPSAIITVYADCCTCQDKQCYILTPCLDQAITPLPIFTQTDLSAYIGMTINTVAYAPTVPPSPPPFIYPANICWTVSRPGTCPCPIVASEITFSTRAFENCDCCNPPPVPLIPLPLRVIPDPVKDFTRDSMSQCEIDVNINFCEAYWNLTKQLRFGIATCEWDKHYPMLWVAKEISDLACQTDPIYCIGEPERCNECDHKPCECEHEHEHRHKHRHHDRCGCHTIYAGMPCREEHAHHHYLLWTDGGILLWDYPNSKFIYQ